ncbi:MAG TPA: DUF2950 domain-containing protein [Syntrophorhabdaceae bacterium]|jgi:hypothetical protein
MIRTVRHGNRGLALLVSFAFLFSFILAFSLLHTSAAYGKETKQRHFSSPEEAVKAMVEALKAHDRKTLVAIYGRGNADLINSGDEVDDRLQRERFLKGYDEKNRIEKVGDRKALLYVGSEDWPFAIPVVKRGNSWVFDTRAGRREMIDRRIGRNELNVIQVCLAYVDAQREFALRDLDRDGLFEYAQKFLSDPGKKDGLYWDAKEGEEPSPLGPLMAAARAEGYSSPKPGEKSVPYHGYYYKILFAQGKNASGGTFSYILDGNMLGGFAMVAYPARYGSSGIMTFMVNQNGVVYQKNLGKNTGKIATKIEKFDPDKTWQKIE